jgi:hypothetical protein
MSDSDQPYKGPSAEELMTLARKAVASLCDIDITAVKEEDGELLCQGESSGILVSATDDPPALVFRTYLLDGIKESAAMYALLNEINADLALGQVYYYAKQKQIRYYHKYFAESPSVDLVKYLILEMNYHADLYDDRLQVRLGGQRFTEVSDDEVDA